MQTSATKDALARDNWECQVHKHFHGVRVNIFMYRPVGYHPALAGGHHAFRRNRVDTPETIIALCSECHYKVEHAIIPKIDIVALLSKITGVNLFQKYRQFCKFTDDDWLKVYP